MRLLLCTAGLTALIAAGCETPPAPGLTPVAVPASAETASVAGVGDAADDPGFWRAENPAASRILGTDKQSGLYVYDLAGETLQYLDVGRVNNIDVRYGFDAGDRTVDIAVATDRTRLGLMVFFIDPDTGEVETAPGGFLPHYFDDPYGLCLWSHADGVDVFFTEDDTGRLSQMRLGFEDGAMTATEVRAFTLGTITEGCAVDDRTGLVYMAEENVGVWRFSADPATGDAREMFAPIDGEALVADAEGVALWPSEAHGDLLVVSSQGDNAYAVFDLETADLVARFEISGGAIDRTTETDGIEVHALPLPGYPEGLFLAQDDAEDTGGQNFKIVDLGAIRAAIAGWSAEPASE
jgi:3-phytase